MSLSPDISWVVGRSEHFDGELSSELSPAHQNLLSGSSDQCLPVSRVHTEGQMGHGGGGNKIDTSYLILSWWILFNWVFVTESLLLVVLTHYQCSVWVSVCTWSRYGHQVWVWPHWVMPGHLDGGQPRTTEAFSVKNYTKEILFR